MPEQANWKQAWHPVQALVGKHLSGPPPVQGPPIDVEAIRRYLEPLEFDCALHHDAQVALQHGHPGLTAPFTSVTSFALGPLWLPGQPLYDSAAPDAQPLHTNVRPFTPAEAPPVGGYFAISMDADYLRPIRVGDRLTRGNPVLLACEPKETRVGRGAFLTLQSDVSDEGGEVVARITSTVFLYEPLAHAAA